MAYREERSGLGSQCKHRRRQRKQMRGSALIRDLAAQFVGDMNADDVVKRWIAAKPERQRTARIESAGPASHDARDQRIGLAADARRYFVAGDSPQGGDLLGNRAAHSGHGEVDARAKFGGIEPRSMEQKSNCGARAG